MIETIHDLARMVRMVYGGEQPPKKLHVVVAADEVLDGAELKATAGKHGTTAARLRGVVEATDPLAQLCHGDFRSAIGEGGEDRVRRSLGRLLVGDLAERAFEAIYESALGTTEFRLTDVRGDRSDTDYRVLNGQERPLFRVNIKFFGAQFRKAPELVELESDDCFALATYKIHSALKRQDTEHLPYVFLIVGVPGVTERTVGDEIPQEFVDLCGIVRYCKVGPTRAVEDAIVSHIALQVHDGGLKATVGAFYEEIHEAQWYALSAKKAYVLLLDLLFRRVYALRVRSFARNYRNAELDMHFSLANDLTPLGEFLRVLKDDGVQGLVGRLERGTF